MLYLFFVYFCRIAQATSSRQQARDAYGRRTPTRLLEAPEWSCEKGWTSLAYTSSRSRPGCRERICIGSECPCLVTVRLQLHRVLTVLALSRHRRCVSRLAEGVAIRTSIHPDAGVFARERIEKPRYHLQRCVCSTHSNSPKRFVAQNTRCTEVAPNASLLRILRLIRNRFAVFHDRREVVSGGIRECLLND